MERWRRIILESGQQSRRVTRPELAEPVKLKTALAAEEPVRLFLEELREAAPIVGVLPATPAGNSRSHRARGRMGRLGAEGRFRMERSFTGTAHPAGRDRGHRGAGGAECRSGQASPRQTAVEQGGAAVL